jgi:putative ABC transport system permease protein
VTAARRPGSARLVARVAVALRALGGHRLRAALTTVSLVIGVAAVVATVSIGAGAETRIAEQMRRIGSNLIVVLTGRRVLERITGTATELTLTEDDARAIGTEIPEVEVVAPIIRGKAQAVYRGANWQTIVTGATPDFLLAREWPLARGEMFGATEIAAGAKVVVLGTTVAESLFGDADALGEVVRVRGVPLRVLGVLEPKGQSAWGQDEDDLVLVPISTAKTKVLGTTRRHGVNTILVRVREGESLSGVREEVQALLRQRHGLTAEQENDFRARLLDEIFEAERQSAETMGRLLALIAAVSLLVGGIGIMNVMLVCVTERTREIGIRMAVGARARDILVQFLIEALTLAGIGGLLGVGAGVAASWAVAELAEWRTQVTPDAIVLAVLLAVAVGVGFGLYPAWRASRLDPVVALGRE